MTQWRLGAPKGESGQAVVEYALVLALVAAGLLIALLLFRDSIGVAYDRAARQVDPTTPAGDPETGVVSPGRSDPGSSDGTHAGARVGAPDGGKGP